MKTTQGKLRGSNPDDQLKLEKKRFAQRQAENPERTSMHLKMLKEVEEGKNHKLSKFILNSKYGNT